MDTLPLIISLHLLYKGSLLRAWSGTLQWYFFELSPSVNDVQVQVRKCIVVVFSCSVMGATNLNSEGSTNFRS